MKTLNRTITSQFYIDPDNGFNEIRKRWKQLLDEGFALTPSHHLLYAILRGRDYRTVFTPVTNEKKLINGQQPFRAAFQARIYLPSALGYFTDLLSSDVAKQIAAVLPTFWHSDETLPEYKGEIGAVR